MAEFTCPTCDHHRIVAEVLIGKSIKCPECHRSSVVQGSNSNSVSESMDCASSSTPIVLREPGGSNRTVLSQAIQLNKESSLEREFITIIDNELPACFTNCFGITTAYEPETDYSAAQYVYCSWYAVKALEDIRAFEARFLLFNLWGRHVKTLTATEIADVPCGSVRRCESKWQLYREHEAREHYASIAYLATIRTGTGQVYNADIETVVAEAKRFSAKFSDTDLEPTPLSG